jgi:hypothetical protein
MSDKSFKVKDGLIVPSLSTAGIVKTNSSGVITSSATLSISEGGTGQTTAGNALNALLPLQTNNTNYFLQTNGVSPQWTLMPPTSYQTSEPTSPVLGQLWIDSDSSATSFDPSIIRRQAFTATGGQTVFTVTNSFTNGFESVYLNGILLARTSDYTTSNSNTITLVSGAAVNDILEVIGITLISPTNTYTQAEIDSIVTTQINGLIDSAPSALNTLNELAAALGDDENFATTVTNSLSGKKNESSSSISSNTNLVAGTRYFVTSASSLTLTLPASASVNHQIDIFDASGNAATYNIVVARNSHKINGNEGNLIIDENGRWTMLVYTGSTYGWAVK